LETVPGVKAPPPLLPPEQLQRARPARHSEKAMAVIPGLLLIDVLAVG
jgi:hypothetical protein